jgi:C4-dicarboxylate-binding protein DctP
MANYTTAQFVVQGNLDWWNGLSAELKEAVTKAGHDAEEWIRGAIAQSENDAEKVIRDAGVEIYSPTAEEREAFVKATESVRKTFAEKTGEVGQTLIEMAITASK